MKVLFVSSGGRNAAPKTLISAQGESLRKAGIALGHFTINRKGLAGYALAIPELKKVLKRRHYDIIHAHYGLAALVALMARGGEKLVVSFMGDDLVGSNTQDGRVTGRSLLLARFNAFCASRFYDFSIVKSREMQSKLKTERVSLVANGVDISLFRPIPKPEARALLGIPAGVRLLLFASDPAREEKNFALAEQAARLVQAPGVKLIALAETPQPALAYYYNAADVVLLTSFHEGSPNVIKEAMACNCPIVSTGVGDVSWVLGKTEGCYLASFSLQDFAGKLRLALAFAAEEGRTTGRKRIIELGLDAETTASRIIGIYEKALGYSPAHEKTHLHARL